MRSPDAPVALVTGATGAIGPAIVRHAASQGWRVRTLTRRPPEPGVLPPDVEAHVGDMTDASVRRRAIDGVDCVLHLAALLHISNADARETAELGRLDAAATAALGRDALAAGVSRVVFFSTIAVYGETARGMATEETPPAPATPYAHSKLASEAAVLELRRGGEPVGTVLRVAAAYGPRVKGNYRSLVHYLASRKPLPVLPGTNRRTIVFDEDVARAAVLAAGRPPPGG